MKKIVFALLAVMALGCFAGCVDHNDGVCDVKDCDVTFGVIRYQEDKELCPLHLAELKED